MRPSEMKKRQHERINRIQLTKLQSEVHVDACFMPVCVCVWSCEVCERTKAELAGADRWLLAGFSRRLIGNRRNVYGAHVDSN